MRPVRPHLQCFSLMTAAIAARAPSMVCWEGAMATTRAERARVREKGRPTTRCLATEGVNTSMRTAGRGAGCNAGAAND